MAYWIYHLMNMPFRKNLLNDLTSEYNYGNMVITIK